MFAAMKSLTRSKIGHVGSTSRSPGQIIQELMLVTKGLLLKSLLFNAIPHNLQGSDEGLQGRHGHLVSFIYLFFLLDRH